MDRLGSSLRHTPEYERLLRGVLTMQILFLLASGLSLLILRENMAARGERALFAAAARAAELCPGETEEIVPLLLGKGTAGEYAAGEALLRRLGYASPAGLSRSYGDPLRESSRPCLWLLLSLQGTAFIPLSLLGARRGLGRLFRVLEELSERIEAALDGNLTACAEETWEEGILSLLFSRYNKLIRRMRAQAESLKGERNFLRRLLSDISHQLKTPLSSLIMYNDLLLGEPDMERDRRGEFLEWSRGQLSRMETLTRGLLTMARLESDSIDFTFVSLDPLGPLNAAAGDMAALAGERTILWEDRRKDRKPIWGDFDWLREALGNILKNGITHTDPEQGIIRFILEESALFSRVVIEDNGPGIPEEERSRIFDRFYKSPSSAGGEGAGIGLSLSRLIFASCGGDIRCGEAEGGGARFVLTFPL